ncbi:hypothetical protein PAI11_38440 [Patulibacter medicamentivorans]|uniref:Uncharacterized protein n=1 Tax=Patulibacter medicamentivorans TaxID=1097667 RepID=H0EAH0_9ACTN|nr:hypothetical protein PAI11_38440 [Patulibacter medicamentivorans]
MLTTPVVVAGFRLNHNQVLTTPVVVATFRLNHNQVTGRR